VVLGIRGQHHDPHREQATLPLVTMTVGAVVQARMTSTRLPGKVLAPLAGRPALVWLLERLERATELDALLVATSVEASDDPVARFCDQRGTRCARGPLDHVAQRMLDAARAAGLDAIARVNGDSPLLDQALVDRGVRLMRETGANLVTNVRPRTFPPGQSVEVLRTEALAAALGDPEHVTGALYAGEGIVRFAQDPPRTTPAFTLDTPEDHARLEAILTRMDRPHWEYRWDELPT
jgi:spore coat polysaccharide biosynthesis protein SpsF (cytidylyltransferase family)